MAYVPKTLRRVRYKVRGKGSFPDDMLRYDGSQPVDTEAKLRIEATRSANILRDGLSKEIELETFFPTYYGNHAYKEGLCPCAKRWQSFLWHVVEDSIKVERVPLSEVPDDMRQPDLRGK
jgi:hypothetical protein